MNLPFRLLAALGLLTAPTLLLSGQEPAASADAQEPVETVIEADTSLDIQMTETEAIFVFTDNVRITGTNILITCDRLEVIAHRGDAPEEGFGDAGRFKSLLATGNVRIIQDEREARCGRAEVLPGEDRIILTQNPVVIDGENYLTGERIVLFRGERRALVEGTEDRPVRAVLPALPDLSFPRTEPAPEAQPPAKPGPGR